ncbi:MAG TPA: hypothetical protein VH349_08525 [Ktedonobacterales bacterium]|jgi:hypothetical protein
MGGLVSLPFRMLFSFLLGIALFLALWETALFNVSARPTAVGLLTEAGVGIINPALTHSALGTFGLSESGFATIQAAAAVRPNDPVTIPGLNVEVRGSEIAGKNFDDATRVVYSKVAEKFYDGGAGAAFSVPSGLQQALGLLTFIPVLGGATTTLNATASPLSAVGLSLNTLTADGHAQVQTFMLWLWAAAGALALVIVFLSRGWSRVRHIGHSLVGSSLLGAALIGIVWYLWRQNPSGFATFSKPLNLVGGAFAPVYLGALIAGLAAYAIAFGGAIFTKSLSAGRAVQQRAFAHMDSPARSRTASERNQPYPPRQYGPQYGSSGQSNGQYGSGGQFGPGAYPPPSSAPQYPQYPQYPQRPAPQQEPGYGSSQRSGYGPNPRPGYRPDYGSGAGGQSSGQSSGWGEPGQAPRWPDQGADDPPRRSRY